MDPVVIIEKYYTRGSRAYDLLMSHSRMVSVKALAIACRVSHLEPDFTFIQEAAMLHDIGIFLTNEPELGCHGDKPYISHGYLGRAIIEKEGFPRHALVCERHVGVGLSLREIREKKLPIPEREMVPMSVEEQIICFADKFFSKVPEFSSLEKPLKVVRKGISKFGPHQLERFDAWLKAFGT